MVYTYQQKKEVKAIARVQGVTQAHNYSKIPKSTIYNWLHDKRIITDVDIFKTRKDKRKIYINGKEFDTTVLIKFIGELRGSSPDVDYPITPIISKKGIVMDYIDDNDGMSLFIKDYQYNMNKYKYSYEKDSYIEL